MRALLLLLCGAAARSATDYRPTPRPADNRPNPFPVSICPAKLKPLPSDACSNAARDESIRRCNDPALKVGTYCDGGDGACTDGDLRNCGDRSLYQVVATDVRHAGCPALGVAAKESCPRELDLVPCDSPGLRPGDFCEGDGECGTDRWLHNCDNDSISGANIYVVLETPRYWDDHDDGYWDDDYSDDDAYLPPCSSVFRWNRVGHCRDEFVLADFEVLVENALANSGPDVPSMEGWWSSRASPGWQVVVRDDARCDAADDDACPSSFRTADSPTTRRQTVPLGVDAEALDSGAVMVRVAEEVRLHHAARPRSSWFVRAMLCRDAACADVVARWAPCEAAAERFYRPGTDWCWSEETPDVQYSWGVVERTFTGAEVVGARFARFEDGGQDGTWDDDEFQNGWRGPWFRAARVSVFKAPEAAAPARGSSKKREALKPWHAALIVLLLVFAGGLAVGLACARRRWREAPEVVAVVEAPALATPVATKNPFDSLPGQSSPPVATPLVGSAIQDGPTAVVVHAESPPSSNVYKNAGP